MIFILLFKCYFTLLIVLVGFQLKIGYIITDLFIFCNDLPAAGTADKHRFTSQSLKCRYLSKFASAKF